MIDAKTARAAWAERCRLRCFADSDLEEAVAIAREFVDCEDVFVPLAAAALQASSLRVLEDNSPEDVVRALMFLARHGIPHGLPAPH